MTRRMKMKVRWKNREKGNREKENRVKGKSLNDHYRERDSARSNYSVNSLNSLDSLNSLNSLTPLFTTLAV